MKIQHRPRKVSASTVRTYRNRHNPNKYVEVKNENDGHTSARQYMKWDTHEGEVKNYNGSKSRRGRYSRMRRDSVNDLLNDYDEVTLGTDSQNQWNRDDVTYNNQRYSVRYNTIDTSPEADPMRMLALFNGQVSEIHPYDKGKYAWARFGQGKVDYIRDGRVIDKSYYTSADDCDIENSEWCDSVVESIIENLECLNANVKSRIVYNSTDVNADNSEDDEIQELWGIFNEFNISGIQDLGCTSDGDIIVTFESNISDEDVDAVGQQLAEIVTDVYNVEVDYNTNGNNVFILSSGYDILCGTDVEDDDSDELLETAEQEYDSAATSINSNKLPAVYKLIQIPEGTVGVDFGGGKFDNAVEHIKDLGATLCVYDPYNRSDEHNKEVLRTLRQNEGADWAINSNVLNVIKEGGARTSVLNNIKRITKPGAPIYITVYEGNGTGQGGPTKSGYQMNRRTADYLEEIQEVFPDAVRKGKLIIAHNSSSVNSASQLPRKSELDSIQSELWTKVKEIATSPEFGFEENDVPLYFRVDPIFTDGMLCIEVGAEVSYDGMQALAEALDPIVDSYYEGAYFDMEAPGLMSAWIPYDDVVETCTDVMSSTVRDHDVESELVEIEIDTDITINEDLSWEYDDTSWASSSASGDKSWYSDNYPSLEIADVNTIIEIVDDFLEDELPLTPGRYHLEANFDLYFDIEGVFDTVHDGGWDEREGAWEDFDTDSEYAEVNYNSDESTMSNLRCEAIDKL